MSLFYDKSLCIQCSHKRLMREIDEMDMLGFLRIRSWKARQDQARQEPVPRYIDEVWPNLKP